MKIDHNIKVTLEHTKDHINSVVDTYTEIALVGAGISKQAGFYLVVTDEEGNTVTILPPKGTKITLEMV